MSKENNAVTPKNTTDGSDKSKSSFKFWSGDLSSLIAYAKYDAGSVVALDAKSKPLGEGAIINLDSLSALAKHDAGVVPSMVPRPK